ncbi:MAG: UPF0280 family protein [Candidatus Bathyarchaeota archaeon]|nr:UPF0280 family protein [Candidatus Bathyarchaeum tardum]WGM89724.1 MAG: UPF0280 family protein [Candidatus Bathyarchaeum tardum]WNZ30180.1 MAG: UPF0280 family protein [Candidatus Bathyarchaeota archaeon]
MTNKKLFKQAFRYKESDCAIVSDTKSGIETAKSSIKRNLQLLEEYIKKNPRFLFSLDPVPVTNAPDVARLMAEASEKAKVGPMAAVAGVLADLAVQDMVDSGCKVAVVENGGEAYAVSNQPIDVGFAAGDEPLSKEMGFRLKQFPLGVATSSGKFSHAFSFGDADAVTIFAINAGLADAAATSVANLITGNDVKATIKTGLNAALSIDGVKGVFILYHEIVGKGGQVPEMIKLNP